MKKIKNIHQLFNTTFTRLRKNVIAGKEFLKKKHLSPVVIALVFAFGAYNNRSSTNKSEKIKLIRGF